MYGLVKLAAEAQDINLNNNYMTREDRLKDRVDEYIDRESELDAQRDPAALSERTRLFNKGALKGLGIGAALGTGAGAFAVPEFGWRGVPLGTIAGASLGLIPGAISGEIKGDNYYKAHENPELLQKIRENERDLSNARKKLDRHYLTEMRVREAELERKRREEEVKKETEERIKRLFAK